MTAKELFKFRHPQDGELPEWAEKLMEEYASQQRTEGIREGFEAARLNMTTTGWRHDPDGYGKSWAITEVLYPTVDDYLNSKK